MEFLQETIKLAKQLTDKPLLIRLDSGNDSIDNVAVLVDEGCFFIIKRNLRQDVANPRAIPFCKNPYAKSD